MGAWGVATFENDAALDWVSDLSDAADISILDVSLEPQFSDSEEYLEIDDGCVMLAAAETVAALAGKGGKDLPPEVRNFSKVVGKQKDRALIDKAIEAVQRVLDEQSELLEVWSEGGECDPDWLEGVQDLLERLRQARG